MIMKKKINVVMMVLFTIGQLISVFSNIFRDKIADFSFGFLEGLSFVFIISGFIYMCWCLAHGKNPYNLIKFRK